MVVSLVKSDKRVLGAMINLPTIETQTCPASTEAEPSLVLKPGLVTICAPGALQFEAYLRSGLGEVITETKLTYGVTFSTSNPAVLAINSLGGAATVISAGIVTVLAQYNGMVASSQVTVMGGEDCCDAIKVSTVLLLDNSKSMGMAFNGAVGSKLAAARQIAKDYADEILSKDEVGVSAFSNFTTEVQAITSDMDAVKSAIETVTQSTGNTRLDIALDAALATLDAADGDRKVMVFFTDGHEQPEFTASERAAFLAKAQTFKDSGGIIICCGIRADVYGFGLLNELSSGGFLLNVLGDGEEPLNDAVTLLAGLLGYYCAGTRPPFGYGYSNAGYNFLDQPPQNQFPDPTADNDTEGTVGPMYSSTKTACVSCDGGEVEAGDVDVDIEPDGTARLITRLSVAVDTTLTNFIRVEGSLDNANWFVIRSGWDVSPTSPTIVETEAPILAAYFRAFGLTAPPNAHYEPIDNEIRIVGISEAAMCATASATSNLSQEDADAKAYALALAQAESKANCVPSISTNGLPVQFNNGNNAPASLYPSAKVVSGLTGTITKVTVALNQIRHYAFEDARLVLVAPDGTAVMLWGVDPSGDAATFISPTDIVIDDDGATEIPRQAAIPTGIYKPTTESGVEAEQLPGTSPTQPYGTQLSDFNGIDPNGSWKLFAYHRNFYTVFSFENAVVLGGWDIEIETA